MNNYQNLYNIIKTIYIQKQEEKSTNYHSYIEIQTRVMEHYQEALKIFPEENILGIFYQGAANYGLDTANSDVDTKCLIIPTVEDLAFNKKPVSYTHVLDNNEHIDFKDVRLYMNEFRKQNINFLEILYTDYYYVNPKYQSFWNKLISKRDEIAHYDEFRALNSMLGMMQNEINRMFKPTESRKEVVEKFGYDPKCFSHLNRLRLFYNYYLNIPYSVCLKCCDNYWRTRLIFYKNGYEDLNFVEFFVENQQEWVKNQYERLSNKRKNYSINVEISNCMDEVLLNIIENYLCSYFQPIAF